MTTEHAPPAPPPADMLEHRTFTCPRCGSHEFEQDKGRGLLCHGYLNGVPCRFRCAADEPRHFTPSGHFYPRTVVAQAVPAPAAPRRAR